MAKINRDTLPGDAEWVRRSFMVPARAIHHQDQVRRLLSSADFKFTDTTLGGSFAINPPPQFTPYADRPVKGRFSGSTYGGEQGRFYSEALDDGGQFIHLGFGVPQFNSLHNFFLNAYNHETSVLARTGRAPGMFYSFGRGLGTVVTLPLQPILWANKIYRFVANKPASKFYYLKPAMPLYWNAVSVIANTIGVNMGIMGKDMSEAEQELNDTDEPGGFSNMAYHRMLPDVYNTDGSIDIMSVSTRAQRLAHNRRKQIEVALQSGTYGSVSEAILALRNVGVMDFGGKSTTAAVQEYHASEPNNENPDSRQDLASRLGIQQEDGEGSFSANEETEHLSATGENFESVKPGFLESLQSELQDGSRFVTFRVSHEGPVSESFSNSVGESALSSKINSMSSMARSARFSFAEGNLSDAPLADMVKAPINAAKDMINGALSSVGMQGLHLLGGSAFVDIPKVWESSTADLPKANYKIELRSPYGTPLSRFQNLVIPLSMLLAGALPLSTGKQSYTSPFLCELFSEGRNQIRLGMVESLSITRGTGNLGWTTDNQPLGIDVDISFIDLSSVMHMPVSPKLFSVSNVTKSLIGDFDDDNAFTDYMGVLGGLGLADMYYPSNKLRLRKAAMSARWSQWTSASYHAKWVASTLPGDILKTLTNQTSR